MTWAPRCEETKNGSHVNLRASERRALTSVRANSPVRKPRTREKAKRSDVTSRTREVSRRFRRTRREVQERKWNAAWHPLLKSSELVASHTDFITPSTAYLPHDRQCARIGHTARRVGQGGDLGKNAAWFLQVTRKGGVNGTSGISRMHDARARRWTIKGKDASRRRLVKTAEHDVRAVLRDDRNRTSRDNEQGMRSMRDPSRDTNATPDSKRVKGGKRDTRRRRSCLQCRHALDDRHTDWITGAGIIYTTNEEATQAIES